MPQAKTILRAFIELIQDTKKPGSLQKSHKTNRSPSKRLSPTQWVAAFQDELFRMAAHRINTPFSHNDPKLIALAMDAQTRALVWGKRKNPPAPARLSWLAWVGNPDHLSAHLNTLRRILAFAREREADLWVSLAAQTSLYRFVRRGKQVRLDLHEGFIDAPDEVLKAVVETAVSRRSTRRTRLIQAYTDGPMFARVATQLANRHQPPTQGRNVDLESIFNAINLEYFLAQIPRPRLMWTRTSTTRTLGKYQGTTDTITLSRSLDSADVPLFVVRFVMYHEMLHKVLGTQVINGRHYGHTAEFRAREKKFKEYADAQEWMKRSTRRDPLSAT
jgi:hypothetical protein